MKIVVFGMGFVGLTTAVGFAIKHLGDKNYKVCGYEIDKNKVEMLNKGQIPFFEEGLEYGLNATLSQNLQITNDIDSALDSANVVFFCIGTPMGEDGSANLDFIKSAICECVKRKSKLAKSVIFVIKSTVPPCSVCEVFIQISGGIPIASNPEFLREGFAYSDFLEPDRIVIGTDSASIKEILSEIYAPFNAPLIWTNTNTAEFIKYLSNTCLSTLISYSNEMSIIAETLGDIDTKLAFRTLHLDKRFFGNPANIISYLYPGLGFGGYCLPKDTLALAKKANDKGAKAEILEKVLQINGDIVDFYVEKISSECEKCAKIGILGLSFKPNSDDCRDSKSAILAQKLLNCGFKNIYAFDPMANEIFQKTYNLPLLYCDSLEEVAEMCEVLIIATAWKDFCNLNVDKKIYNLRFV
ncbi:UDP-glucose dehydrogenase family protein [Helicobacter sp. 23-1045]